MPATHPRPPHHRPPAVRRLFPSLSLPLSLSSPLSCGRPPPAPPPPAPALAAPHPAQAAGDPTPLSLLFSLSLPFSLSSPTTPPPPAPHPAPAPALAAPAAPPPRPDARDNREKREAEGDGGAGGWGVGGPGLGGAGVGKRERGEERREREGKRERKGGSSAAGVGAGGGSPGLGWSGPSGLGGPGWGREKSRERKGRRQPEKVPEVGRRRRSPAVNRSPAAEKTWGGKVYMRKYIYDFVFVDVVICADHKVPLPTTLGNGKAVPVCSELGLCSEHPNPRIKPQTDISLPDPRSTCHLTAHRPCPCTHQLQAQSTYYYCCTSHHHLPPHTLAEPAPAGAGDNHPPVPCAGSGSTWRQSIGPVAPASLSLVTPRVWSFFLAETLPLPSLISSPTDLSIGVSMTDTTPVSQSPRGASLLQVIDGGATGQS
ncbi:hypothetical protein TIFTF001_030984 [Ficus carica]|uniref:Uncharacterized protein n=1 Tax=Ficus carica TaxID=3494 RepID=A0AA88DUA0_FICCA|nr:hypothetical protein TIFTF001_030984 [Ficus carica]